jgi:hypothetical protein
VNPIKPGTVTTEVPLLLSLTNGVVSVLEKLLQVGTGELSALVAELVEAVVFFWLPVATFSATFFAADLALTRVSLAVLSDGLGILQEFPSIQ